MRIHTGAVQRIVCGAVSLLLAAGVFFSLPVHRKNSVFFLPMQGALYAPVA